MCGRYGLYQSKLSYENSLEEAGGLDYAGIPLEMEPAYDIAPYRKKPLPFVAAGAVTFAQWGLIPAWWKKPLSELHYTFNATAEKISEGSPFWRRPVERRQLCLVPMSGFYEWQWQADGKSKVRHLIRLQDPATFACAGLWEEWKSPEGKPVKSFTIITCPANRLMAKVHNPPGKPPRMPVILTGEKAAAWSNPEGFTKEQVLEFLKPFPDDEMLAYPVVNRPAHDPGELVVPIGEPVRL